jgi:hypothetical protein
MQMLTCIQVLFNATTTTKYAILDLILLNADTYVSTERTDIIASGDTMLEGHGVDHLSLGVERASE